MRPLTDCGTDFKNSSVLITTVRGFLAYSPLRIIRADDILALVTCGRSRSASTLPSLSKTFIKTIIRIILLKFAAKLRYFSGSTMLLPRIKSLL